MVPEIANILRIAPKEFNLQKKKSGGGEECAELLENTAAWSPSQVLVSSKVPRAEVRYLTGNLLLLAAAAEDPGSQGPWTTNKHKSPESQK